MGNKSIEGEDNGVIWVRKDVADRMVAEEREACAQIAQRVSDENVAALDDLYAGDPGYHFHDGASDAAERIADLIDARREDDPAAGR